MCGAHAGTLDAPWPAERIMTYKALLVTAAGVAAMALPALSQTTYRRATLVSSGDPDVGRCTVSVTVDGAADVEFRGGGATLRNVTGTPPRFREMECTGRLPDSPADLRVRAIDGNGRLTLTHNSDDPGLAKVRVVNLQGGDQLYRFDLTWNLRPAATSVSNEADRMMMDDDASQACQAAVENRLRSDGYRYIRFNPTHSETSDFITGTATASGAYGYDSFSFGCEMDPRDGRVRTNNVTRK
jgi:hypothetical protein